MSSPISGFTAIPNPQMLAFMPIQSYLMMYFAGSGWQYGKRKISAMSNEQFNKLTPEELLRQHSIELKNMLPTLDKTLNDVTPLVRVLIEQYGDFVKAALHVIPEVSRDVFASTFGNIQNEIPEFLTRVEDIVKWIIRQFPNMPEAQAYDIAQAKTKQSTISGLTVSQAQQQARDKQIAFEREQARLKAIRDRQLRSPTFVESFKTPTAQIARTNLTGKKAAGQSQIRERKNLILQIKQHGSQIAFYSKINNTAARNKMGYFNGLMRKAQQSLVNLLARYKF